MLPWVARFRRADALSAVSLRLDVGVEVAEAEGFVWMRGPKLDDRTAQRVRCLPVAAMYDVWPDGQLVVHGNRVPTLQIPDADWRPIRDWFPTGLPITLSVMDSNTAGLAFWRSIGFRQSSVNLELVQ